MWSKATNQYRICHLAPADDGKLTVLLPFSVALVLWGNYAEQEICQFCNQHTTPSAMMNQRAGVDGRMATWMVIDAIKLLRDHILRSSTFTIFLGIVSAFGSRLAVGVTLTLLID
jgi:hypothetical protein